MGIIGFIFVVLFLGYLTLSLIAWPMLSGLGSGMKGSETFSWFACAAILCGLWYLAFIHSPFSIVAN